MKHLRDAMSEPGISFETKRKRLTKVLSKLGELIEKYPELLTCGPSNSAKFLYLWFTWH